MTRSLLAAAALAFLVILGAWRWYGESGEADRPLREPDAPASTLSGGSAAREAVRSSPSAPDPDEDDEFRNEFEIEARDRLTGVAVRIGSAVLRLKASGARGGELALEIWGSNVNSPALAALVREADGAKLEIAGSLVADDPRRTVRVVGGAVEDIGDFAGNLILTVEAFGVVRARVSPPPEPSEPATLDVQRKFVPPPGVRAGWTGNVHTPRDHRRRFVEAAAVDPRRDFDWTGFVARNEWTDIPVPFAARYFVVAAAGSAVRPEIRELEVKLGAVCVVDFALRPAPTISGVLLDEAGSPVAGALVDVECRRSLRTGELFPGGVAGGVGISRSRGAELAWATKRLRATTDEEGRFLLRSPFAGDVIARVDEAEGRAFARSRGSEVERSVALQLELRPRNPTRRVRVIGADGEPAADFRLNVFEEGDPPELRSFPPFRADGEGWLDVTWLDEGQRYEAESTKGGARSAFVAEDGAEIRLR
ncbi:MAG: hypothetical protein R3F20_19575 [Planctomycetota bacterium]